MGSVVSRARHQCRHRADCGRFRSTAESASDPQESWPRRRIRSPKAPRLARHSASVCYAGLGPDSESRASEPTVPLLGPVAFRHRRPTKRPSGRSRPLLERWHAQAPDLVVHEMRQPEVAECPFDDDGAVAHLDGRHDLVRLRIDARDGVAAVVGDEERLVLGRPEPRRVRADLDDRELLPALRVDPGDGLAARFETQTSPELASTDVGVFPASIGVTSFVAGSMRKISVPEVEPTQTDPEAAVMFAGDPPVSMVATSLPVSGSWRVTVPSTLFVTQTVPSAYPTSQGSLPTGMRRVTFPRSGSTRSSMSVP
jgi:hypothetical protein